MRLQNDITTLGTVEAVAVGGGSDVFSASKMGAGTNITREQIQNFGSIKRDLQDYARLDPRVVQTDKTRGELSVLGQNSRYNSVTIDGVSVNDTFGLEGNNLPTERQPISIDAIDEVQVNVTNYDVAQPRYSGANINAVTKSGTNDFHGSATYVFRDSDMVGDLDGAKFQGFQDEKTYGGTFGGPLVKDKLFFFLSYEKFARTAPGASNGPAGSGAAIGGEPRHARHPFALAKLRARFPDQVQYAVPLVALEDLERPVGRAVVRRNDEVHPRAEVVRDVRVDHVGLVLHEQGESQLHAPSLDWRRCRARATAPSSRGRLRRGRRA